MNFHKPRSHQWRWSGCFVIFGIICLSCCSSIALYAYGAGEWASSGVIPSHSSSVLLGEKRINDALYNITTRVYQTRQTMGEAVLWFRQFITMDKKDLGYDSIPSTVNPTWPYLFYTMAGNALRSKPGITYSYEEIPECFRVNLFAPVQFLKSNTYYQYFSDLSLPTDNQYIIAVIQTCYPNW